MLRSGSELKLAILEKLRTKKNPNPCSISGECTKMLKGCVCSFIDRFFLTL